MPTIRRSLLVVVCASILSAWGCSKGGLSPEQFDKILKDNPVVLVDFQADWCGPCRDMKPIVHELAKDYQGKVKVLEVDVDASRDLARKYGAPPIPLFVIFKNGVEAERVLGAGPRGELEGALKRVLAGISPEQFDKILKDNPLVLVDFQADWCGPCREMKPIVHELAKNYQGKVKVVEVDVDASPDLARKYGAARIPFFLIFKNGKVADEIEGAVPRGELEGALKRVLESPR